MSDEAAVLFVDDEPRILNGLRRMLHSMRHQWHMAFATGGAEALKILRSGQFDVIVSDMRMAGMNGVELLGEVLARYPRTVRIVLSGQASKMTVLRSIGLAHQYLAKPCDAGTLTAALSRVCALRALVADGDVSRAILAVTALPSLPSLYGRLVEQVQSPEASINEIGRTISGDLGMSARVLQLVSSAFFGEPTNLLVPGKAAVLLGLDIVKALVKSANAFAEFDAASVSPLGVDSLWRHSRCVARCAGMIAGAQNADPRAADGAFVAGMLHDAGKAVLAAEFPERYASILALDQAHPDAVTGAERREFGATHAQVGACLMGLWGLPDSVVEAIASHHDPADRSTGDFAISMAVRAADVLVRRNEAADETGLPPETHLAGTDLADRLPLWRELSQEAMNEEMANV